MTVRKNAYIDELEATYIDDGCDLAPKCLECPFPMCRYDYPTGGAARTGIRNRERNDAIVAALDAGEHSEDVAARFGVSRRTVFRIKAASHPWGTDTLDIALDVKAARSRLPAGSPRHRMNSSITTMAKH